MKKRYLGLLALATILTSGLAVVNEHGFNKVDAAGGKATLVNDISSLTVGSQVIIAATEFDVALSTTQNGNNRGQANITKSGNEITFGDEVQVFTVEAGNTSGTYAFNTGSGYIYAAGINDDKNWLRTEVGLSSNSSWSVEIDSSGVATVKSTGGTKRNWIRYNSAENNGKLFSCYSSGQADISIYKVSGSVSESELLTGSVTKYYGDDGVYTKKTNINISDDALNDLQKNNPDLTIADYYHGGANSERTTYYNGTALLMGNIDGTFKGVNGVTTGINSGYGLGENGSMTHFKLNNDGETVTYDYTVAKGQHDNWKDKETAGMEGFYTTLEDMTKKGYFEGWESDTYNVTGVDDEYLADFLAFVAPCLESTIYASATANFLTATGMKLSVSEETKDIFDIAQNKYVTHEYLALRIYVSSGDASKVTNEAGILAEARIYKDLLVCDEEFVQTYNITIPEFENGSVTASQVTNVPYGTEVTFTATADEGYSVGYLRVDGTPLTEKNGVYSCVVKKNVTVEASFVSNSLKQPTKITSTSQLISGNTYYLGVTVSGITKYFSGISTTSTKYGLAVDKDYTSAYLLTLTYNSSLSAYTISYENNGTKYYLYWTSGNSLNSSTSLQSSNKSYWTISFDNSGVCTIANKNNSSRTIKWNNSSPRFACYDSGQTAIELYSF